MRERSSSDHHALNLKNITEWSGEQKNVFVDGKHINFVMTFSLIKFNTNEVLIGPLSIGQLGCLFSWLALALRARMLQSVRIYNRL